MIRKLLLLCCSVLGISGCGMTPKDYQEAQLVLDIRDYLNGRVTAHGMIFDWKGKASRHFVAKIDGAWEGNKGTLDELFTYSDGTTERRVWTLTFSDDHHFTATAGDVDGVAQGSQYGNALNMRYRLKLTDPAITVSIDDWMYLTAENVLLNRSAISKFGVPVGEVVIAFTKEADE